MSKPRLLDTYCCSGGASYGYQLAGFDVTGVDIDYQPNYVGDRFIRADAVQYIRDHGAEYDAIAGSPPCQRFSSITPAHTRNSWPDLIGPTRDAMRATGRPYVIENVEGAKWELESPIRLCGSSFGLRVRRHRWFESNIWLTGLPCRHSEQGDPVGIYGDHADSREFLRPDGTRRGAKATTLDDARDAIGMPWATWHEAAEAVPPAYTEWIGAQLMDALVTA